MTIPKNYLSALKKAFQGQPLWVVGGCVRDRLMGRSTPDFDFVLLKDPKVPAEKFAKLVGGSAFRLDDAFAITRVSVPGGAQFDFGRIQGKTLEEDIDRRDFTVNALAVPLEDYASPAWKARVIDRHNGVKDLAQKRLCAVSPGVFKNDPLRLLRAARLSAQLEFTIDAATLKLIKKDAKRILRSAPERVREEMLQIFDTPRSADALEAINKAGLLDALLPDAKALRKTGHVYYGKEGVLRHTLDSLRLLEGIFATLPSWFPKCAGKVAEYLNQPLGRHPMSAHLKWAVLLHDLGKPDTAQVREGRLRFFEHEHAGADKIPALAKKFRWASDEARLYEKMVRHHMRPGNLATHDEVTDKALHRFFRDLDRDAVGMLLVSLGDHLSYLTPKERQKRSSSHEKLTVRMMTRYFLERKKILPEKLINGHDLMKALDVPPSPLVGQLLKEVLEAQAEGAVHTKAEALAWAKKRLPQ